MDAEPNHRGSSRRWLVREVEASLSRLDTDHIDLYQMHRWDDEADIEETLSALTDLQRAGKIRYFGSSSFPAHRLVEAQWAAARCGLGRMVTEQPQYSMLVRGIEADVLAVVQQYGLGVLVWSPLAAGWLSGRHRSEGAAPGQSRTRWSPGRYDMSLPENQRKLQLVERLAAVADDHDLSLIQLALAFTTSHPAVTSAIIGPRTHEHLDSQLAAADLSLSDELLDAIDAIVPPGTTAPGEETGQPPAVTERRLRRRG
jgi:aryl-alcohol dehydrogenase-like predicted oxidoreductase